MFIWDYVSGLTDSEHNGGGLAVAAESLEAAREMLKTRLPEVKARGFGGVVKCTALDEEPDITYELHPDEQEPDVHVFPDQGCCQ